eukprot:c30707_g1_i1 orf=46-369(+)
MPNILMKRLRERQNSPRSKTHLKWPQIQQVDMVWQRQQKQNANERIKIADELQAGHLQNAAKKCQKTCFQRLGTKSLEKQTQKQISSRRTRLKWVAQQKIGTKGGKH